MFQRATEEANGSTAGLHESPVGVIGDCRVDVLLVKAMELTSRPNQATGTWQELVCHFGFSSSVMGTIR